MKMKLNLKLLIPAMILFLLLPGCNTGAAVNISSGVPASSEKTSESSETSSVDSLSEPASSDVSTTSSEDSSSKTSTSTPQPNSKPATSSEKSSSANTSSAASAESIQPIKVDKLKQPTKVSITYADTVPGKAVDFEEKTIDISIANDNWTSHIAIIRSYDELKSIYEGEKETFPKDLYIYFERDDYSKMYTEEFFEDKAIVMLFVHRGLKAKTYSIDSVTKNDNRLYIYMDNVVLDDDKQYIQVSADYRTFISVSKEDMSGITDIVVCEK